MPPVVTSPKHKSWDKVTQVKTSHTVQSHLTSLLTRGKSVTNIALRAVEPLVTHVMITAAVARIYCFIHDIVAFATGDAPQVIPEISAASARQLFLCDCLSSFALCLDAYYNAMQYSNTA